MAAKRSARDLAQWGQFPDGSVQLDHVELVESDLKWLGQARRVTMWAVKHPPDLLSKLVNLEWLDVRGGSGQSADFVRGCRGLRYLSINQIRGLADLAAVADLGANVEFLSIYGQPQVKALPDLSGLTRLARLELGSLKGLTSGLRPALRAPRLQELLLIRSVNLAEDDAALIRDHPSLREFDWFSEDVPRRIVEPVLETAGKPPTRAVFANEWFAGRA